MLLYQIRTIPWSLYNWHQGLVIQDQIYPDLLSTYQFHNQVIHMNLMFNNCNENKTKVTLIYIREIIPCISNQTIMIKINVHIKNLYQNSWFPINWDTVVTSSRCKVTASPKAYISFKSISHRNAPYRDVNDRQWIITSRCTSSPASSGVQFVVFIHPNERYKRTNLMLLA